MKTKTRAEAAHLERVASLGCCAIFVSGKKVMLDAAEHELHGAFARTLGVMA